MSEGNNHDYIQSLIDGIALNSGFHRELSSIVSDLTDKNALEIANILRTLESEKMPITLELLEASILQEPLGI